MTLDEFGLALESLVDLDDPRARPFDCDGSPLDCRVFIVGSNPRMQLREPFRSYWSDTWGFDKGRFIDDYVQECGKLKRTREKIETIINRTLPTAILVTNVYPYTSTNEKELDRSYKKKDVLRFLLNVIAPDAILAHGNEAIHFFENEGAEFKVIPLRHLGRHWVDLDMICDELDQVLRAH